MDLLFITLLALSEAMSCFPLETKWIFSLLLPISWKAFGTYRTRAQYTLNIN